MDEKQLINRLNDRENSAFSSVYMLYFDELYYFGQRLFQDSSISAKDVIQDIFANIWQNNSIQFNSIDLLRAYLFTAVKNKHKDYLRRHIVETKYNENIKKLDEYHFSTMVETQVVSLISTVDGELPKEMSKVIKLLIEGYEVKEISEILNKSVNTIYSQKNEAIKIMKKRLSGSKFIYFLTFFN